MRPSNHIPADVLLDYVEGRADRTAAEDVRAHLETGCARCQSELALWQRALPALAVDRLPAPPESVVQRAVALFRPGPRPEPFLRRLVASLTFDSRLQPALAGVRSAGQASFQVLFSAGDVEIDLLCERAGDTWRLTGQALAADRPDALWSVTAEGGGTARSAVSDSSGEFQLENLTPGPWRISLRGDGDEITLPPVDLAE